MRLLSLKMHNFMGYKGLHEIDFELSQDAPILLFLGENGHGKSSIQHAVRWCLYGATEAKRVSIPSNKLLNRKSATGLPRGENPHMVVELRWEGDGKIYELERKWSAKNTSDAGEATLRIDGGNPVPATSIPHHVNRYLARSVAHFFFFDGEVQDEFDAMVTNASSAAFIKHEIENLLSIPVLAQGVAWLKEQESDQYTAISRANRENERVSKAATKLQEIEQRLGVYRSELEQSRQKLSTAESRIAIMEDEIKNVQSAEQLMRDIEQLRGEKKSLTAQRSIKVEEIRNVLFANPWIPLANQLISLLSSTDSAIEDARIRSTLLQQRQSEMEMLQSIEQTHVCPLCGQHKDADIRMKDRINKLIDEIRDLAPADAESLIATRSNLNDAHVNSAALSEIRNLKKELDSFGAQIALTGQALESKTREMDLLSNNDVQSVLTSIKALLEDKSTAEREIQSYEESIASCEREAAAQKKVVSQGQGVDPSLRIKYQSYGYLADLLNEAKSAYSHQIKEKVQEYSSETFLSIISDPKYAGLRINENYGIDLIMSGGEIDSLNSTGQGKVSTIALVSGLIKTAMAEGFILMDTPFVSLDNGHREAVCRWAASSGLYISFFMHSGEYNEDQIREYLGGKIGRIYRINRIDDNESTVSIEQSGV